MPKMLGGSAGVLLVAAGLGLVLPVDVHQKEEAEGNHGEQRFQSVANDYDETFAEAVEARKGY